MLDAFKAVYSHYFPALSKCFDIYMAYAYKKTYVSLEIVNFIKMFRTPDLENFLNGTIEDKDIVACLP